MLNHQQIRGLLFDKDGTLIDFSASWLQAMKDVTQRIADAADQPELAMSLLVDGGYLPDSDNWTSDSAIAFETSEMIFARWSSMTSPELINSLLPELQSIIYASLKNAVPVIERLPQYFQKLEAKYALGVASMDDEINVRQTLKGIGISDSVAFYCGADSGYGIKPGPGMVQAFCKQLNLAPEQIAVIGDARHDLKMARRAGALAIGVLSGASSAHTLSDLADYIINDIGELSLALEGDIPIS